MRKIIFACLLTLSINSVLIQTIMGDSNNSKNLVRILVLFIMISCIFIKNRGASLGIFFLINLSVMLLLIRHNSDQITFIFIFMFIQSLFLVETKKIEKYLLLSSVTSLIIIFVFLFLGITENTILDYGNRDRMTFGVSGGVPFFYNLVYGTFSLIIIYSQKYFRKFKLSILLISISLTTYFYIMTDARGGYYSFIMFIILLFLTPRIKIMRHIIALLPPIFIGTAFFIASLSNSYLANQILSLRPILIKSFLNNISLIDLLLSRSVKAFDTMNIVDNSYLHLLIGGGIFIAIAISYLFFKAIVNLYKEKKYVEISFIISTCIYFNSESIMVRIENMFVVYFWYLIFKYSIQYKDEQNLGEVLY